MYAARGRLLFDERRRKSPLIPEGKGRGSASLVIFQKGETCS